MLEEAPFGLMGGKNSDVESDLDMGRITAHRNAGYKGRLRWAHVKFFHHHAKTRAAKHENG